MINSRTANRITSAYIDDACTSLSDQVDKALAPVRACLEGLSTYVVAGLPCWCESRHTPDSREALADDDHCEPCLAARAVWEQVQVRE